MLPLLPGFPRRSNALYQSLNLTRVHRDAAGLKQVLLGFPEAGFVCPF
jgi:hypothetical protein